MTTASAGPSGFHTKHFVAAFAVAGFVAAILVIAQWLGSDTRPVLPPTDQAVTEVAVSEASVSANWEAFAAGKLDDAPVPSAAATQPPVTDSVETGTSGNWINYNDGKFEDTQALAAVEAGTSGNWINYNDGKFEDAEAQPRTYERAVSGGHQPF